AASLPMALQSGILRKVRHWAGQLILWRARQCSGDRSMGIKLKRLEDQVMVITGATSGIGLATAKRAAERGARLVLCSRNETELQETVDQIQRNGGIARSLVADVSDQDSMERLAATAVEEFGSLDTWVNNAGVSFYGRLTEVAIEDMRQLFEVNFWGTVYGTRAAVAQMRGTGGALINIGSIVSDRAVPLQGAYSASKHAIKGFTDALRMELEEEGVPVSVTLIKPSAIDTPYFKHAKNYMEVQPKPPAPVYAPEVVANAILRAAEHPVRDITIGGGGRFISALGTALPRLTDFYMERAMFSSQRSDIPSEGRSGNLYQPAEEENRERGGYQGHVMRSSVYTQAALSPARALLVAGLGLAVFAGIRSLTSSGED
ncbi:MAG TPA: SDR family oxidoreductase, partial [Gemmatimonadales bacterium]|nr:SDR family oxidoreductase [Gemmatimonadales bacterium]